MNTPFPQANDIYKVIWLIDSKISQKLAKSLDFINMNISLRQIEYYQNAGEFLGLLSEGMPTKLAMEIFIKSKEDVINKVAKLVKESIIFNQYYFNVDKSEVVSLLKKLYKYSHSTAERRFVTVKSWTEWAKKILKEREK
jgi:5'(3')-deoxyribonucleotidase